MQRFLRVLSVCVGISLVLTLVYIFIWNGGSFDGILWRVALPVIGAMVLAIVSAIALLIYEPHKGWQRLTLILALFGGVLLSLLIYFLLGVSTFNFRFDEFRTLYALVFPLIVFVMIGGRKAVLWIKDGFERSEA